VCLILFAWQAHDDYPLVVAANRDEFYQRASATAGFWLDHPHVLAGRDLEGGGSWMGVTRGGRFAAVTNYRDPADARGKEARSRGDLVRAFLAGQDSAQAYVAGVERTGGAYRGFNLLAGDGESLWYHSNCGGPARRLDPGVYGLSNHLLDTDWPKVSTGRQRLREALHPAPSADALFSLLADAVPAEDAALPSTGVPLERERLLSPARIVSDTYGTRCSTVLLAHREGGWRYAERSWGPQGVEGRIVRHAFRVAPQNPVR
jgi:uncharacterized protein with NRDE domain